MMPRWNAGWIAFWLAGCRRDSIVSRLPTAWKAGISQCANKMAIQLPHSMIKSDLAMRLPSPSREAVSYFKLMLRLAVSI